MHDEIDTELRRTLIDRVPKVESIMLINLFCFASSATFLKSTRVTSDCRDSR